MNKHELIIAMKNRCELNKKQIETALTAFIDSIEHGLSVDNKKVKLVGFGTFEVKRRQKRIGKNLHTGEKIEIPETNAVIFSASSKLKRLVNE